jgi:hypothetical protein
MHGAIFLRSWHVLNHEYGQLYLYLFTAEQFVRNVSEETLTSIFRIDESASSSVMTHPCCPQIGTGLIKEFSGAGT